MLLHPGISAACENCCRAWGASAEWNPLRSAELWTACNLCVVLLPQINPLFTPAPAPPVEVSTGPGALNAGGPVLTRGGVFAGAAAG